MLARTPTLHRRLSCTPLATTHDIVRRSEPPPQRRLARMYFTTYLLLTYVSVQVAVAFKLPFHIPWVSAAFGDYEQTPLALPDEQPSNRIAVIGAGAGGSAAAFWIGKAKERFGLDVEVDVYDSNPYIGGRTCRLSVPLSGL